MRTIKLTQGQVALVDDEDYEMLVAFKWYAMWNPSTRSFYAARNSRDASGKRTPSYIHRLVVGAHPGESVDHLDHNTLNNRRANLRRCSKQENSMNQRRHSNNTSGFKGVSRHRQKKRWRASIEVDGKRRHLGLFDTAREAARAYDAAALEHFGEFALTNESFGIVPGRVGEER